MKMTLTSLIFVSFDMSSKQLKRKISLISDVNKRKKMDNKSNKTKDEK